MESYAHTPGALQDPAWGGLPQVPSVHPLRALRGGPRGARADAARRMRGPPVAGRAAAGEGLSENCLGDARPGKERGSEVKG